MPKHCAASLGVKLASKLAQVNLVWQHDHIPARDLVSPLIDTNATSFVLSIVVQIVKVVAKSAHSL